MRVSHAASEVSHCRNNPARPGSTKQKPKLLPCLDDRLVTYGCANSFAIGVAEQVFCKHPSPNASWIVANRL